MKQRLPLFAGLYLALIAFHGGTAHACTIFVLTDTEQTLFCNNEDWSNPATRIWFVPAGKGHLGCTYVGFDDGWAQGGMNTEGLAFDWVAGFQETWQPDPALRSVPGNPCKRMLETCSTVDDAVAFYKTHRETGFSYAKILIADRTGASVIVGAKDGKLQVEKSTQCRGFGYGQATLDQMLDPSTKPTVENAASILQACLQKGQYATKYSNIFNLASGNIFLFRFPEQSDEVKLNLSAELEKGAHYYDIPQIRDQVTKTPQPLQNNMKTVYLSEFTPIPDAEPDITNHFQSLLKKAAEGTLDPIDFTGEFWSAIADKQKEIQSDLGSLGDIVSLTLVDRQEENGLRRLRYRIDFQNARVLIRYDLNSQNKVAAIETEDIEEQPAATIGHS